MEVVRIGKERLGEASDVLARAFHDDPAWVWLIRTRTAVPGSCRGSSGSAST